MQSRANTRKTGKEQYYTNRDIAIRCSEIASKYIGKDHLVVEPAGGTGEFIEAMKSVGFKQLYSTDIEPKHPEVLEGSWLDVLHLDKPFSVITNPPFGRMNSLSVKFFNHAAHLGAEYICFLIPVSWRKWSLMNRLALNYELVDDVDLPNEHLFYGDDVDTSKVNVLKSIFQVWKRTDTPRKKITVEEKGFLTRSSPEDADIQIIHQGWSCGKVNSTFDRTKNVNGTNYYKAEEGVVRVLEQLTDGGYDEFTKNCAYVASISLAEINSKLNEIL